MEYKIKHELMAIQIVTLLSCVLMFLIMFIRDDQLLLITLSINIAVLVLSCVLYFMELAVKTNVVIERESV